MTHLHLILGDQLIPDPVVNSGATVVMAEDRGLCTQWRTHVHKIIVFLAAMRHYADDLRTAGHQLIYFRIDDPQWWPTTLEDKLTAAVRATGAQVLRVIEPADQSMRSRLQIWAAQTDTTIETLPNPVFLTSDLAWSEWASGRRQLRMGDFYSWQRRRLKVMVDDDGSPHGGRWSFDQDNRQALPDTEPLPPHPWSEPSGHAVAIAALCPQLFADHPGNPETFWLPVTRAATLAWLEDFAVNRLAGFGPYEDACPARAPVLWHSVLAPMMNMGLVTAAEIVSRIMAQPDVPIASREGFIRQVIGWREFIRGIDLRHGAAQWKANHWEHHRQLSPAWYRAETGIPPWDHVLAGVRERAWCHHIERLMVLGNALNLLEIHPHAAHRWFMENFCDSAEWVMGPNVFGMALHSDGGLFATKPYLCAANYLRTMGGWKAGPWCDEIDGLYWGFIARHRDRLLANPRTAQAARGLDRIGSERRERIARAAAALRARVTLPPV